METATKIGVIAVYHDDRGFGFITEDCDRFTQWFFHVKNCRVEPKRGLRVQFSVGEGRKGPMAVEVDVVGPSTIASVAAQKLVDATQEGGK